MGTLRLKLRQDLLLVEFVAAKRWISAERVATVRHGMLAYLNTVFS
jgi:hypothetical protein